MAEAWERTELLLGGVALERLARCRVAVWHGFCFVGVEKETQP